MENKTKILFVIFITLAMFIGCMMGCAVTEQLMTLKIQKAYSEKEQPMLMLEFYEWGENIYDESERLFQYFIYNYGNTEAKNVKINCKIFDIDKNIIKEEIFNIGNIASNSYEFQESVMINSDDFFNSLGMCYIESVNGDYINLLDRLDDIR